MNQLKNKKLKAKSGEVMPLTAEGSLGLLALGDIGLQLWREAIEAKNEAESNRISSIDKDSSI